MRKIIAVRLFLTVSAAFVMAACTFKESVLSKSPPVDLMVSESNARHMGWRPAQSIVAKKITGTFRGSGVQNYIMKAHIGGVNEDFQETFKMLQKSGMTCAKVTAMLIEPGRFLDVDYTVGNEPTEVVTGFQIVCLEKSCGDVVLTTSNDGIAHHFFEGDKYRNTVLFYVPNERRARRDVVRLTNDADPRYRHFPSAVNVFVWVRRSFSSPMAELIYGMRKDLITGDGLVPFPISLIYPASPDFPEVKGC